MLQVCLSVGPRMHPGSNLLLNILLQDLMATLYDDDGEEKKEEVEEKKDEPEKEEDPIDEFNLRTPG